MDIIADKYIPFLDKYLPKYVTVCYMDGKDITAGALGSAEALLVRTRTICNDKLLKNSI